MPLRYGYARQNSATDSDEELTTKPYYKLASYTFPNKTSYSDEQIVFTIKGGYGTNANRYGKLMIDIRIGADGTIEESSVQVIFVQLTKQLDANLFTLAWDSDSTTPTVELWVKNSLPWYNWYIFIDTINRSTNIKPYDSDWVLYKTSSVGGESEITSGYTTKTAAVAITGNIITINSENIYIKKVAPYYYLQETGFNKGKTPDTSYYQCLNVLDTDSRRLWRLEGATYADMSSNLSLINYRKTSDETYSEIGLSEIRLNTSVSDYGMVRLRATDPSATYYAVRLTSSDAAFRPETTRQLSLGTSSYLWTDLYFSGVLTNKTYTLSLQNLYDAVEYVYEQLGYDSSDIGIYCAEHCY